MLEALKNKVLIIVGPTATGKSKLAIDIALKINGIIINADSAQVYKEAPILTAQPSLCDMQIVPHKLFGIISLSNSFSVTDWKNLALKEIKQSFKNNSIPIIVGGTGFYISTLINGLVDIPKISESNKQIALEMLNNIGLEKFKELVKKIDPEIICKVQDKYRLLRAYEVFLQTSIPLSTWQKQPRKSDFLYEYSIIKLIPDRSIIYNNINKRFKAMLSNGILEEAKSIMNSNIESTKYKKIIGLQEIINYLNNEYSFNFMVEKINQRTRNYAKRQITWFKHQLKDFSTLDTLDFLF